MQPLRRVTSLALRRQSVANATTTVAAVASSSICRVIAAGHTCTATSSMRATAVPSVSSCIARRGMTTCVGTPQEVKDAPPSIDRNLPDENKYDLIVIGSGPSGQKCAISAAKKKKRVCIIDKKDMLGGVCIHTGTIPSKTFREAVLYFTGSRHRAFYGKGHQERTSFGSTDILDRVNKVVDWETETVLDQLTRNRVVTVQGTAQFLDEHHIEIKPDGTGPHSRTGETVIRGDKILIACGTRPAHNPNILVDGTKVFDSDLILTSGAWQSARDLIVVGAGVIAMEYASMFNALPTCRVTVIDERPSFLDFVDHELSATLKYLMTKQGATFRLGEKVKSVTTPERGGVVVEMESGSIARGDALFYAVGRQANTDSLNLGATRVASNKRGIVSVNENFQTAAPHIYATGDVIGFPALASTAMEQGRLASLHMFEPGYQPKPFRFPYGIYTIPEISVIGKNEQELQKTKTPYAIGVAKFGETAKGQMIGRDIEGFLKLLFDPVTHKLLGCHAIGESATEIIHIGQMALKHEATIEEFRDSIFNYPTMAESYRIAALDGLGKVGVY